MTQDVAEGGEKMPMQCFPLYTLLLALGNPTVDFLSLDVEVCFKQNWLVFGETPWFQGTWTGSARNSSLGKGGGTIITFCY